ncbi:MAG: hypothetical protein ACYSUB_01920 [Planctomycetota bacterium]|jgi:hypothetical protein
MSVTLKAFADGMIDAWRVKIGWITIAEGIILLRNLGGFERDKVISMDKKGYRSVPAKHLLSIYNPSEYCINIRPIYFRGGPIGGKLFKGTFLTLVLDRLLLTSHEKGSVYVERMVEYARSFTTINPNA